jgi:hypothetical protein
MAAIFPDRQKPEWHVRGTIAAFHLTTPIVMLVA